MKKSDSVFVMRRAKLVTANARFLNDSAVTRLIKRCEMIRVSSPRGNISRKISDGREEDRGKGRVPALFYTW